MQTAAGYLCGGCNKFLKSRRNMRRHVIESHINAGLSYQCPGCNGLYRSQNSLSSHVYTNHPHMRGLNFNKLVVRKPT